MGLAEAAKRVTGNGLKDDDIEARRESLQRLVTPSQGFAAVDATASRFALLRQVAALVGR